MPDERKPYVEGWRGVAAHFNKSVTTVQNWHKLHPMPLGRTPRGRIVAEEAELDAWYRRFAQLPDLDL